MPMPRKSKDLVPVAELRAAWEQSGLQPGAFAALIGVPAGTFRYYMGHDTPVTRTVVLAARFTLLRLGHSITIEPVPAQLLRAKPTSRKNPSPPSTPVRKNLAQILRKAQ